MRKLSREKRCLILNLLCEGLGVNAVARVSKVSNVTVLRLLADIGLVCRRYHDKHVRNLLSRRVEVDEVWAFVGCKEASRKKGKQGHGDAWLWCGMDSDTRLVISYHVGRRGGIDGIRFMSDLADRLTGRVQLSSDAHPAYDLAVRSAFRDDVDWARIIKVFGKASAVDQTRYSPAPCIACKKEAAIGSPDLSKASTSLCERQNLGLRTQNRRHTRLTNGFSRKFANHCHAISLHYFCYNFVKVHGTIKMTPAMASGLTDRPWTVSDLVGLLEEAENESPFGPIGSRINRADRS